MEFLKKPQAQSPEDVCRDSRCFIDSTIVCGLDSPILLNNENRRFFSRDFRTGATIVGVLRKVQILKMYYKRYSKIILKNSKHSMMRSMQKLTEIIGLIELLKWWKSS